MKTLRKFLYGEVIGAVTLVTLGFIALFFFFDFVEELQNVARNANVGYQIPQALAYVGLMAPSHVYELLPITVLIGTIFVMSRFAQSSEFTILRTSGLGPWRALRTLGLLGLAFTVFTFAVGDYIAPYADKTAQRLRAQFLGNLTIGKTGAWLKDRQLYGHYAVNVSALTPETQMRDVQIFEYDNKGFMVSITRADTATFGDGDYWQLFNVKRTDFPEVGNPRAVIGLTSAGRTALAHQGHGRNGGSCRVKARAHGNSSAVSVHAAPQEQWPVCTEVRDSILEKSVLPTELPGYGGARPTFRVFPLSLWLYRDLCVWRGHGWYQLRTLEQRTQ